MLRRGGEIAGSFDGTETASRQRRAGFGPGGAQGRHESHEIRRLQPCLAAPDAALGRRRNFDPRVARPGRLNFGGRAGFPTEPRAGPGRAAPGQILGAEAQVERRAAFCSLAQGRGEKFRPVLRKTRRVQRQRGLAGERFIAQRAGQAVGARLVAELRRKIARLRAVERRLDRGLRRPWPRRRFALGLGVALEGRFGEIDPAVEIDPPHVLGPDQARLERQEVFGEHVGVQGERHPPPLPIEGPAPVERPLRTGDPRGEIEALERKNRDAAAPDRHIGVAQDEIIELHIAGERRRAGAIGVQHDLRVIEHGLGELQLALQQAGQSESENRLFGVDLSEVARKVEFLGAELRRGQEMQGDRAVEPRPRACRPRQFGGDRGPNGVEIHDIGRGEGGGEEGDQRDADIGQEVAHDSIRPHQPRNSTKVSSTSLRPALSKSIVSLAPSTAATEPGPNFW